MEEVFKETPVFANISFSSDSQEKNLTESQFNQYVDNEINQLLEDIPYLNALVSIHNEKSEDKYSSRVFIQGKEVKDTNRNVSEYPYTLMLNKKFPTFNVLEPKDKYIND